VQSIFSQQYSSGYTAIVYGSNTVIIAMTPEGWVCDYQFAQFSENPCAFLKEDAYTDQGINTTHYMYIYFEEGHPLDPDEYVKIDIERYRQDGYDPEIIEIECNIENTTDIEKYGLYEFSGLPKTYKELVFILKTRISNVFCDYGYMIGDHELTQVEKEENEKTYQQNIPGYYELIKTISVKAVNHVYPQDNGFILYD
jgi:hypothetical protein